MGKKNLEVCLTREGLSASEKEDDVQVVMLRQLINMFHEGAHIDFYPKESKMLQSKRSGADSC